MYNNGPVTKFSAIAADNGFAVFTGSSLNEGSSMVVQFDNNGYEKWIRRYSFKRNSGNSIQQTTDGGYIVIGSSIEDKMKLVKISPEVLTSTTYHAENVNISILQNSLTFPLEKMYQYLELNIYNINGKLEKKINIESDSKIHLESGLLGTGVYLYEINEGFKFVQRGKISIF